MIISMYYPLFEGKECIGYVGADVFASRLMDSLLNLDIKGLPNKEYVFLNVENGTYLYHEDNSLRTNVGILCAAVAAVIILFTLLILFREGRELMVMEKSIRRLGNLELSADQELEAFYGRKDEIGMIAQTIHHVCESCEKRLMILAGFSVRWQPAISPWTWRKMNLITAAISKFSQKASRASVPTWWR